jgi:hypothetical protein
MNAVRCPAVESAVRLVVADLGAGVLQDLLTGLGSLEWRVLPGFICRNPVDLLCIENGVHAMDEPRTPAF